MDKYRDHPVHKMFPHIVTHHNIIVPLTVEETFLAYDHDQKLWAYKAKPTWSPASQKWIPQDHDTPRHIFTWKGAQVNAKDSIECFPVNS